MKKRTDNRHFLPVALAGGIVARVIRWHRRRKADARIIAQAKAVGVWDNKPLILGGRALELKAWEAFKIKRIPGESDAHLRLRLAKLEIIKQKAEEHGCRIKKTKTDGYNVKVILCDENHKTGGHKNE